MTYTKFHADWKDKPSKETPVTSQALEHIENGVAAAHVTADAAIPKSVVDAKGDLVVATGADALTRLPVGGDAQYLTADSGTATGLRWRALTGTINASVVDAKGDLIVASADDTVGRLAVGTNGQVLTADSGSTYGAVWASPTGMDVQVKSGALTVQDNVLPAGAVCVAAVAVTSVAVRLGTAPTGASVTVRVKRGASTLATVSVSAGTASATGVVSFSLAKGDVLTFDVTAVGSSVAGADLAVALLAD